MSRAKQKKVAIVVLGDIGRSPRMQYHGLSFANEGYNVTFVGYAGSKPLEKLTSNQNVKFRYIHDCPEFKNYFPTVLAYILKFFWQTMTLLIALIMANFPDFVLVQNPPAVPSLGVCYVYCRLFRSKFIIDWHNYAFSLLALSVGANHLLVKISNAFEFYFGKKADSNICVTKAMKQDLEKYYGIKAVTFYDRPPEFFRSPTLQEKHELLLSLGSELDIFVRNCEPEETIFTKKVHGSEVILKDDRPGLLITSTSWTLDENMNILLEALKEYDKAKESSDLPKLICAITGKGPLKDFYSEVIKRHDWKNVEFVTPWLRAEDYHLFLGCADMGVSLHQSSSGFDLPMKVVDMFGCGVPVCAIHFLCIEELVHHGKNGFVFKDELELSEQLQKWFKGFPAPESLHLIFEENLKNFQSLRWHENWKLNVQPLF